MRRAVAATAAAALLSGCVGGPGAPDVAAEPEASVEEIHLAAEHMEVWAHTLVKAIDEHVELSGDPHARAPLLRAHLDFLLREHTYLLVLVAFARITDRPALADAARAQLTDNTEALVREVRQLYGDAAADEFETYWRQLIAALLNFAEGLATDDADVQQTAVEQAHEAVEDLVDWAEDVTSDTVDSEELRHLLELQVDRTLEALEAIAELRAPWYPRAYAAVEHMKEVARLLAEAIATDLRLEGSATSRAAAVLAEMSGAMETNVLFTALATRALLADRPEDARTAEDVVSETTEVMTHVVEETLGPEVASRWRELWARHIDLFLAYTRAVDDGPTPPAEVRDQLAEWTRTFAEFVGDALGGAISAHVVEQDAATHVATVVDVVEAQAAAIRG